MNEIVMYLLVGLGSGIFGGIFGVGGGLIIIPALVLLFGFEFKKATGTSLAALVPPSGILGAYNYYKDHNVSIWAAIYIAIGLFVGYYIGSLLVPHLSNMLLKRIFALILIFVAVRLFDPVGFVAQISKMLGKN